METIVIHPSLKYAKKQALYNALWFSFLSVLFVVALLFILFPRFFFYTLPLYKEIFSFSFQVRDFIIKIAIAFTLMFLMSFIGKYFSIFTAIKDKDVFLTADGDGVTSQYGMFKQKVSWDNYTNFNLTDFPFRIRFNKRKRLFVYNLYEKKALNRKINELKEHFKGQS